jgi:hypothetical protein
MIMKIKRIFAKIALLVILSFLAPFGICFDIAERAYKKLNGTIEAKKPIQTA